MLITTSDKCPYSEYLPIETVCCWYRPRYSATWGTYEHDSPQQVMEYIYSNLIADADNDGGSAIIGFRLLVSEAALVIGYGTSIRKP